MDRRAFLNTTLATAASASVGTAHAASGDASVPTTPLLSALYYRSLVPEVFANAAAPRAHSRNLVIGSGFGGAISALRLAQAGEPVTVLERGFQWPRSDTRAIFSNDTAPDGRAFWFKNRVRMLTGFEAWMAPFGGVMDATEYDNMTVWRGACVGGGSVVFTGVMIQPERRYFDNIFQGAVKFDEMDAVYYPRVRRMLNLGSMPEDVYQSASFGHSRQWDAHVRKAGFTPSRIDSLFNWDVIRKENKGLSRKSATVGLSNHGNANGAKNDLNQNYLKWAQATGLVSVHAGHEVLRIGHDGSVYTVEVMQRSVTGQVLRRATLTCDRLFLAAGSVGTSELLVRAQAEGALRNLNEHTGAGWGTNGDAIVVRSFASIKGLTQGSASASRIHDTRGGMPVTFENWYAPGVPIDIGVLGSLGMAYDETNRGRFVHDPATGRVKLNWAANGNDDAFAAIRSLNNRIAAASGTAVGLWPFIADVNGRNWTAHPLGGAVIGQVTDTHGRVKGHPGLYVMDGAAIPGTTGSVNPSLTISALAERNIERIISAGG
jgi:cholesterol oxidase